jgi:hypothetical protein
VGAIEINVDLKAGGSILQTMTFNPLIVYRRRTVGGSFGENT